MDTRNYLELGVENLYKHDYFTAIENFTSGIAKEALHSGTANKSLNFGAWNNRGVAYLGLENYKKAEENFTHAITLYPEDYKVYQTRGRVYYLQKEYNKAIKDCSKIIELVPNHKVAYLNRALLYQLIGNEKAALDDNIKANDMQSMSDEVSHLYSTPVSVCLNNLFKPKNVTPVPEVDAKSNSCTPQ